MPSTSAMRKKAMPGATIGLAAATSYAGSVRDELAHHTVDQAHRRAAEDVSAPTCPIRRRGIQPLSSILSLFWSQALQPPLANGKKQHGQVLGMFDTAVSRHCERRWL